MKQILPNAKIFILFSALSWKLCLGDAGEKTVIGHSTTLQIVEEYGYPGEAHKVETEDGYILELHRIPHGRFTSSTRNIPVLLTHGLFGTSSEFLSLGNRSIAFLLSEDGYDVWMSNFRGNTYSLSHKYLSPSDEKFWDYSWHEHGVYDLPASIDYICNYTKSDDVLYLGFSMGTTAFLAMASIRPEYQRKIRGAISLGPAAAQMYTRSPIRVLAPFCFSQGFRQIFQGTQIALHSPQFMNVSEYICNLIQKTHACRNYIFFIAGAESEEYEEGTLPILLKHFYSYTSLKTLAHYGQTIVYGKLTQFYYGLRGNLKKYGSIRTPEYNLGLITTPHSLFLAPNDYFVAKNDLQYLLERLNCVKNIYVVPHEKFTHIDFVIGRHANRLVYGKVLEQLKFLTNDGKNAKSMKNFEQIYQQINF